jgi:hypothetical protein
VVELLRSTWGGWLVVGRRSLEDYLARTKCRGRIWSPEAAPDASLAMTFGGWRPRPA